MTRKARLISSTWISLIFHAQNTMLLMVSIQVACQGSSIILAVLISHLILSSRTVVTARYMTSRFLLTESLMLVKNLPMITSRLLKVILIRMNRAWSACADQKSAEVESFKLLLLFLGDK